MQIAKGMPKHPGSMPGVVAILLLAGRLLAHPELVIDCERATEPPVIDGDLTDWADVVWLSFGPGEDRPDVQMSWLRDDGATEPAGTALTDRDLAGQVGLRWDDEFLYLAAKVRDNVVDVDGSTAQAWYHRDGVTMFFDVPRDGDGPGWVSGDHCLNFSADPCHPPHGRWWRRGTPRGHLESPAPGEVIHEVVLTGDGYRLEARVPLALLAAFTPGFRPPFQGREVGFLFIVTDPDGGDDPFGGQLLFGGGGDDDAAWARLRFVDPGQARAPRLQPSPEWEAFRARLDIDLKLVGPLFAGGGDSARADSVQSVMAEWYFEQYLAHRPSRLATKAVWMACTLWGNAGDVTHLRAAVAAIGADEDVWEEMVPGLRKAYVRQDGFSELMTVLEELSARVLPLKSRSVLLYTLAEHWVGLSQDHRARPVLEKIVRWRASPWYARRAYELLLLIEQRHQRGAESSRRI
jgi:hypothetical protein